MIKIYTAIIFGFFSVTVAASDSGAIPRGEHVQIGGNSIYAVTFGAGVPVIFESGLGHGIQDWQKIAPSVAKHAQVILYDRAGIGRSTLSKQKSKARTAQDIVNELTILLNKLHAKPPYVLVGHSAGGLYVQLFARENAEKIKGIVLVDSMNSNQNSYDKIPGKNSKAYFEALGIKESQKQVIQTKPFPNVRLIVLSATIHGDADSPFNSAKNKSKWGEWQSQLATMSGRSQYITANDTGHFIQKDRPWLVIAAIKNLVEGN